jgi:hypothetical protein
VEEHEEDRSRRGGARIGCSFRAGTDARTCFGRSGAAGSSLMKRSRNRGSAPLGFVLVVLAIGFPTAARPAATTIPRRDARPAVAAKVAPANTVAPTVSGVTRAGATLTGTLGSWSGTAPISLQPYWRRCDTAGLNCATIAGATALSYTLTAADVGATIRLRVVATNVAGTAEASSAATGVVTAVGPTNTAVPTVSGVVAVGRTLSGTLGSWSGTAPISLQPWWRRCDGAGFNCANIAGATSLAYTLTSADIGATVRLRVIATNAAGTAEASSAATGVVGAAVCSAYASPSGSDGASGSALAPWRSAQFLVDHLSSGQTGCLFAGTYGSVVFAKGGTSLISVPGQRATLLGYVWVQSSANGVTLRDLNIDGHDAAKVTVQVQGDGVTLRALDITNRNKVDTTYNGICLAAGHWFEQDQANTAVNLTIAQSRIHNCGNDAHEHAIYLESTHNAHIVDNYLYDNPGYGIQMYPDAQASLIEHNVIDGNSSQCRANLTFAGQGAGGDYSQGHSSSNNVVQYSLITNSLCRYNVESYYPPAAPTPVGNVVQNSCVWNAPWGNFGYTSGYTQRNNLDTDPLYVDRASKDFRLQAGSPCAAWGPQALPPPQ